ncbi:YkvA family protein [Desulfuromonas sp. CSMB_57]|uniref:YkvA family protein n=1 Tax=Desulfuromonas sp. CSMB_57 TaxID=2807629 RepID=UPI001CD6E6E4|nr:YkvA family protein [Desulfuromonas sp. CSMB_57]
MSVAEGYEKEFSDSGFWDKIVKYAKAAGEEVIEKALWLYYAAQNPQTPRWAKTTIYSALGYFILPFDVIPDFIPVAGYGDDLGVLAAAIATVSIYITEEVKAQAKKKQKEWFGN